MSGYLASPRARALLADYRRDPASIRGLSGGEKAAVAILAHDTALLDRLGWPDAATAARHYGWR